MGILGQKNLGNSRIPRIKFRIHKVLLASLRYKQFSLFALSFGLLMLDSSYVVLPEELSFILFDCEVFDGCEDKNLESKLKLLQKALENKKP